MGDLSAASGYGECYAHSFYNGDRQVEKLLEGFAVMTGGGSKFGS